MLTKAIIIALLMKIPAWKGDEQEANREDRIEIIAESILKASQENPFLGSSDEMAYLLINQGWWESKFAKHVHEGNCRVSIGECDSGRAGSPWQLQYGHWFPKKEWDKIVGADLEATTLAANRAAITLNKSVNLCISRHGNNPAMYAFWATSAYATSKSCSNEKSKERMPYLKKIKAMAHDLNSVAKKEQKDPPKEKEAHRDQPKATKEG